MGIQRYGDEDVWAFLMNSKELGCIFLRDYRCGLVYKGWIELYSDSGSSRELVLQDVEVFENASGVRLYEVPRLYVSRDQYEISIEIADNDREETDDSQRRTDPTS